MEMPKKFYVSRQYRGTDQIVGFMVDADKEHTKAFEKKKSSADKWANYGGQNKLDPIYIDNEPKTGFLMVTNVSRYSTSNVVWRCRHPEGFEFEITSSNMCDLIANNTIVNGEFKDAMFFNANRELINANTKTYSKMIEVAKTKDNLKDFEDNLKEGDGLVYDSGSSKVDFVYLGTYHAICMNKNKDYNFPAKSSKVHVVQNLNTGNYFVRSSMATPNVHLASKNNHKVDRQHVISSIQSFVNDANNVRQSNQFEPLDDYRDVVVIADKSFKFSDLTVEYTDEVLKSIGHFKETMIYLGEKKGITHRVFFGLAVNKSAGSNYYRNDYDICTKALLNFEYLAAYPCTVLPNGDVHMEGVDMTDHKTFHSYHYTSPFFRPTKKYWSHSGDKGVPMVHIDTPETIKVGRYKLGK